MRRGVPEYLRSRYGVPEKPGGAWGSAHGNEQERKKDYAISDVLRVGRLMEELADRGSIGGAKPDVAGIQRREKKLFSKPKEGTPLKTGRDEIMAIVEKARAEAAGQLRRNPPIAKPSATPKSGVLEDAREGMALMKEAAGKKDALKELGEDLESKGKTTHTGYAKSAAEIAREKEEERRKDEAQRRRRGY